MEVLLNPRLDKYCKMLYFWNGKPTSLGKLSNFQLEKIVKFINKYPQGLLNGYEKKIYLEGVEYILNWRNNDISKFNELVNIRHQGKAEKFADDLLNLIIKAVLNTEKQREKVC